ncbi:helix-turn-helix domain-containing protein [Bacillaceae bacterium SIJ1]|uniref:helix-turn-helix domain-containing protein n=1 Tax=Litoribacterium kuwaitense TaxID=1398745 RepID=UPI0013ECDF9A|nr:helix-turn-helix domain-containing protein [Litoribacterium kuwaitense]NGP45982.1 helix-turn-helix domain-containing protein [Litoribacterium kuwaitense]
MSGRGRKSKYQTHVAPHLKDIEHWCRDGMIEEEIAKRLGVAVSTFNVYKNDYPELQEALKTGKQEADYAVEDALFKRALGYEYEEETYVAVEMNREEYDLKVDIELEKWNEKNPNATQAERDSFIMSIPKTKQVLEKKVKKQISPDVTAQIFWLKNRKPADWRDKQDIEHSGGVTNQVDLSGLSVEELKKLANSDDNN